MRKASSPSSGSFNPTTSTIWGIWNSGGPFVGDDGAAHSRVTVETDWVLRKSATSTIGNWNKGPARYWICQNVTPTETEVPNIKSIEIDRNLESDAATCTITLYNQWMDLNTAGQEGELGNPGYFTFNRGSSADAKARWGHVANQWSNVLTPNALLRTYQGYGGRSKTLTQAFVDGNVLLTGVWLIDEVQIKTDGTIDLKCRDLAKLLIEQILYPPLIPENLYPLEYCRYEWRDVTRQITTNVGGALGERPVTFSLSGNQAWYGASGCVAGHCPTHALDGNAQTYWLSVGNVGPNEPFSVEYLQVDVNAWVDTIYVHPWAGNYNVYISVYEGGVWQTNGAGNIPYNEAGVGRYNGTYEARIPYVLKTGIAWETATTFKLPRAYNAQKVRVTFTNLANSGIGPYPFRAGMRELRCRLENEVLDNSSITEHLRFDGNYKDYVDIVRDLLMWSGFWLCKTMNSNETPVPIGNTESTGAFADDGDTGCMPDDMFDKKTVIDAITKLKEIVGYIFFIDDEGHARFESPNWWRSGNFLEDGTGTDYAAEIDEKLQLTEYGVLFTDKYDASEIIISTENPTEHFSDTLTTRFVPPTASALRGMVRPAMWFNGVFTNEADQKRMAELIALHIWFSQRQGNVTCAANPCIQINDQVRIWERQTGETYVHYVRGVHTSHDLDTGEYTMTLTTCWLGDQTRWAITAANLQNSVGANVV